MSLLSSSCGKGTGSTPINFLYVHMSILPMGSPQYGWRRPCGGGSAVGACPPYSLTPGDLEWSPDKHTHTRMDTDIDTDTCKCT